MPILVILMKKALKFIEKLKERASFNVLKLFGQNKN